LRSQALSRALATRNPAWRRVRHSDRGSQYGSANDQALLRKRDVLISMCGRGICDDTALLETVLQAIAYELIWPVAWSSRARTENAIARLHRRVP